MKRYTISWLEEGGHIVAIEMSEDDGGQYVIYSEAQARIEALEWLEEVQDFGWTCDIGDCELTDAAYDGLILIYRAARAAVEGK